MIYETISDIRIIQSQNPNEVETKYRELMQDLAGKNPKAKTGFDSSIGHYAHITWEYEVKKPEDIREEMNLKGIKYVCGECPRFDLPEDKRIKNVFCETAGRKVSYDCNACLLLYQQVASGEVRIDL